jgi:hypothetical protein
MVGTARNLVPKFNDGSDQSFAKSYKFDEINLFDLQHRLALGQKHFILFGSGVFCSALVGITRLPLAISY